jgi:hypothetical protein
MSLMVTTFPPRRRGWILSFLYDPSKVRVRYNLNFKSARRLPPEHEIGMRGPELHCPFRVSYLIRLLLVAHTQNTRSDFLHI